MVTGLRALANAEPKGECELDRICQVMACTCEHGSDDEARRVVGRRDGDEVRSVLMRARDMVEVAGEVAQVWWVCGVTSGSARQDNTKEKLADMASADRFGFYEAVQKVAL
jgi:hypothetical protein